MGNRTKLAAAFASVVLGAGVIAACGDDEESTATAESASAPQMLMLSGEDTTLALDAETAKVLKDNMVSVAPAEGASAGDDGIAFPITGGEVDSESLAGTIEHSGGLRFEAGGTRVTLTDFVIDTAAGTLTATGGDAPGLTVLDVNLDGLERDDRNGAIVLSGITTALSDDAAKALNDAFGVDLFEGGLPIGDVTVTASA